MSSFLVTGGAGFAGSHIVAELLNQGHTVTSLDCLTYAGSLERLKPVFCDRLKILHHDFEKPVPLGNVDYVIHNGAASHVLRSLESPKTFLTSNVLGTLNLLEWSRFPLLKKFVYVSTDEVFGPGGKEPYHEGDKLRPTNPYSASKAGGEFLTRSYYRSFGVPALITRTVNLFGEYQNPEKFIPKAIGQILKGEEVEIHAENSEIGSRQWVYVGEQAKALSWLAREGTPGKAYHIAEGVRRNNAEIAENIASILRMPLKYRLMKYAWEGHDCHYNMSVRGTPEHVNWKMKESFETLLERTVLWYRDNPRWLE